MLRLTVSPTEWTARPLRGFRLQAKEGGSWVANRKWLEAQMGV
jgi:hypothetical protein